MSERKQVETSAGTCMRVVRAVLPGTCGVEATVLEPVTLPENCGVDAEITESAPLWEFSGPAFRPWGGNSTRHSRLKDAAPISPIRCPYTASRTVISVPSAAHFPAIRNTRAMRTTCSATWEKAGTRDFWAP